jgi:hypothetical protein
MHILGLFSQILTGESNLAKYPLQKKGIGEKGKERLHYKDDTGEKLYCRVGRLS